MLVSQVGLHFGLEYQPQRRIGVRVGGVQFQCLFQGHLGALSHALLQITNAQLHVGIARLVTAFAGLHRVVVARKHTASTEAGQ
ncbi:hypothetical protein D3C76_1499880 [compost metagenome]